VGAVLTQRTSWTNVERAIANLKREYLLAPAQLMALPQEHLVELIHPAGYFNQKARRLRAVVQYLMDRCSGDLDRLAGILTGVLREELLEINGIGPETADSILLYALNRPIFVVDAYTKRALARIGMVDDGADYLAVKRLFESHLRREVGLFNDYHAQWVALGKEFCRTKPRCAQCPIKDLCETGSADVVRG